MNANEHVARVVCELLESGSPLVLASIVGLQGSSPRHQGTKMVVGPDGRSYGTIGGSLLEHTVVREASRVLDDRKPRSMDFDLADSGAYSSGMVCGGKAVVLLDYIPATKENLGLFRCWREAVSRGGSFYFLTHIREGRDGTVVSGHSLLFPDGRVVGHSAVAASQLDSLMARLGSVSTTTVVPTEHTHVVVDPISSAETLYCFGAGHVAVPTARIAAMVGFRVVVVDDRTDFASAERFPDADEVRVIEDFGTALEGLGIGDRSFIVILTRGHQFDQVVLEQALKTEACYIGMIGSRTKRDAIFQSLLAKGVTREELERVHSPIGIDIGSETPEEIAVSIVAQLITERARHPA